MNKPVSKYSNSPIWKLWLVSMSMQIYAWILSKITGRKMTHGFYYSKKQRGDSPSIYLFRGKVYSEMRELKHGWCNWKDSKLVGIGSDSDLEFQNVKEQP